jgi:nucleoside 2-deoxyribosyltransferase
MMDEKIVYYAGAIDSVKDKGRTEREYFKKIVEQCGCKMIGAGFDDNPIISSNSPLSLQKKIAANDLELLKKSDIILVVTDLSTFAVGTWIEMHEASKLGQPIIIFIKNNSKVKNIFINTYSNKIIYNDIDELKSTLKKFRRKEKINFEWRWKSLN